ncbi:MAG: helix-turn-helix transcriptional regulator [Bacteroidales bacterium]|jgi:transcriptional regulator with XRE-family HTH domain|nr:helix-turn-helix transcriptional regulator [Bacteroidales bacterium]MDD4217222.1 helix-turn-helix transcriptional regulator [Bacteroidales bacterium]MDY0141075.1 helix-turn-helix transcriptional regulator [Bacteroidales bacterium]
MSSLFGNKLKSLRGKKRIPQRRLSAILEIDTATYCKIEKGDRKARREQVYILADFLDTDVKKLLQLWSADKVYEIIADEEDASQILNVVAENISNCRHQKVKL